MRKYYAQLRKTLQAPCTGANEVTMAAEAAGVT